MARRRLFMQLDWAAYLGDTRHLSTLEHGAYLLLIAHYWQHKGLPSDEAALARIAGLSPEEWPRVRDALSGLFKLGNWKHRRIEAELTEAARLSRAGRTGGIASGAARRKKAQARDHRTIAAQSFNDPPTKREALKEREDTEGAIAPSAADAACAMQKPIYRNARHELWGEGVAILTQLGLPERRARENIGRWLRDAQDDVSVLGAIQRARDHGVIDPVPWITRALTGGKHVAQADSLVAAAERAAERARALLAAEHEASAAGAGGAAGGDAGAAGAGDGAGEAVLWLIPEK